MKSVLRTGFKVHPQNPTYGPIIRYPKPHLHPPNSFTTFRVIPQTDTHTDEPVGKMARALLSFKRPTRVPIELQLS